LLLRLKLAVAQDTVGVQHGELANLFQRALILIRVAPISGLGCITP
jgi:hypothetical protein